MAISTTVIGKFDSDASAWQCVRRLCNRKVIPLNISVAGADSRIIRVKTAEQLSTREQGKYMCLLGIAGAVIGAILVAVVFFAGPEGMFLKEVGLISCFALGAVLGCMAGTLIGAIIGSAISESSGAGSKEQLPAELIVIGVKVDEVSREQAVKTIMEDCGAVSVASRQDEESMKDNGDTLEVAL